MKKARWGDQRALWQTRKRGNENLPAKDESNKDVEAVQQAVAEARRFSREALIAKGLTDEEIDADVKLLHAVTPTDLLNQKSVLGFVLQALEATYPPAMMALGRNDDPDAPAIHFRSAVVDGRWEITARRIR